jgi:integrase
MAAATKSTFPGVRYREHATRKHGIKPDRYFFIRYKLAGKDREEGAGWASEGVTAAKASELLAMVKNNIRAGVRPQSLAEMRDMAEQARQQEVRAAKLEERRNTSFAEFWESDYLPSCTAKTARTVGYETGMARKWLFPAIGEIPLQALTPAMLQSIAAQAHKGGKSPATVTKVFGIVSQVWSLAAARGVVAGDCPTKQVKTVRRDNRRMRFLSEGEARKLLDALQARSPDMHDIALFALFAGLRAGEIHGLTWGDVNLDAGTLYIRDPKNKVSRHAHITPEIRAVLVRRGANGMNRPDYVFPARDGGQRRWVSDTFERVVEALGFNDGIEDARQKVVFHSLRHTFASWLVQRGVPLYTVAELMGHTTLEMTKRYSHLAPDTMRAAAMGLSGILDRKPAKVIPLQGRRVEGE